MQATNKHSAAAATGRCPQKYTTCFNSTYHDQPLAGARISNDMSFGNLKVTSATMSDLVRLGNREVVAGNLHRSTSIGLHRSGLFQYTRHSLHTNVRSVPACATASIAAPACLQHRHTMLHSSQRLEDRGLRPWGCFGNDLSAVSRLCKHMMTDLWQQQQLMPN